MDWSQAHAGPRARALAPLDQVEVCWRMRSLQKATRVLTCGIYRDAVGLELRIGYSENDLLRSQRLRDVAHGRQLAEALRAAVVAKGGFEDLEP